MTSRFLPDQLIRLMYHTTVTDQSVIVSPLDDVASTGFIIGPLSGTLGVGGIVSFEVQNLSASVNLLLTCDIVNGFTASNGSHMDNWIVIPPGVSWQTFYRDITQQINTETLAWAHGIQGFALKAASGSVECCGSVDFWRPALPLI